MNRDQLRQLGFRRLIQAWEENSPDTPRTVSNLLAFGEKKGVFSQFFREVYKTQRARTTVLGKALLKERGAVWSRSVIRTIRDPRTKKNLAWLEEASGVDAESARDLLARFKALCQASTFPLPEPWRELYYDACEFLFPGSTADIKR